MVPRKPCCHSDQTKRMGSFFKLKIICWCNKHNKELRKNPRRGSLWIAPEAFRGIRTDKPQPRSGWTPSYNKPDNKFPSKVLWSLQTLLSLEWQVFAKFAIRWWRDSTLTTNDPLAEFHFCDLASSLYGVWLPWSGLHRRGRSRFIPCGIQTELSTCSILKTELFQPFFCCIPVLLPMQHFPINSGMSRNHRGIWFVFSARIRNIGCGTRSVNSAHLASFLRIWTLHICIPFHCNLGVPMIFRYLPKRGCQMGRWMN